MYQETLDKFAQLARKKANLLNNAFGSFCIGAMMAGAYIGFGIILIFTIGGSLDPAWQKLAMGLSFGIALTLIVFAGAELFTGHTMYMVIGWLSRKTSMLDLIKIWCTSWTFNLIGAVLLAYLFVLGGGGELLHNGAPLLNKVAAYKINSSILELLARATLCNWLVCLALWMAARTDNDVAKTIVIFWCLFAFIASGFEHSIANMSVLTIALLGHHPESISLGGMAYNLFWVTIGNIIGGSIFMALGYWKASNANRPELIAQTETSIFDTPNKEKPSPL